ncbi:Non-hemolytic phospholipase C [Beauveria bassiana]|uniref:Non-hemolytic phospholipase C n=1 Tax=Beauveria bassiana (strain ARSEF 2860) TaxID=655819 RepID=J4VZC2_BEAB2|nr:non-hemolytic phospholipase C precursor [Beauveria bassiana ARSEF 2860]EJP63655.1 non-hemolytic phospholipase C precursor [Beauveria bassiana ARSEF 2860]KAF1734634.1 Non-hemolytic phospholipase C [Beauveria bassiana]KAH8708832.1 Non-hemolytic phospholipase C [Beauveria bassiana]
MKPTNTPLWATLAVAVVRAASLTDVKHIVLFMQENRAFDHYFGTMAGVRGFGDPNVQVNDDGYTVFEQQMTNAQNGTHTLKPWHINYLGGEWEDSTQCMGGGDNGWYAMHKAYNGGLGNQWTQAEAWNTDDGGYAMGYFKRQDLATHFDIAEGWTLLDMNTQSVLAATDPNRIMWMSGSINIPGSPTNPDGEGGLIIDNSATPGCEQPKINCFPFVWKTFPEYLEDAGVSWQVWQDFDNFEDNMLAYFEQYQKAANGSALREKGNSYPGLDAFYAAASRGTLPQVSIIVGPQELAEHSPNMPVDGAWLQKRVVDAITGSPAYNETILIVSYDEQGGWMDHVVPMVAPKDTPGEWLNVESLGGESPVGPGWRAPRYIISPWTRGGNVFTEPSDHTSDIMFIEAWAQANGYDVETPNITPWRRKHMSNLVNAFDFGHTDYSVPPIASVRMPETDPDKPWDGNLTLGSLSGPWVGPARCLQEHAIGNRPPIPYGQDNAKQEMASLVEDGFKTLRGQLTEGRYVVFQAGDFALANLDRSVGISPGNSKHDKIEQRWILHSLADYGKEFYLQSAKDKKYIGSKGRLTSDRSEAQTFTINYHADAIAYTLHAGDGKNAVTVEARSQKRNVKREVDWSGYGTQFTAYSVSYKS